MPHCGRGMGWDGVPTLATQQLGELRSLGSMTCPPPRASEACHPGRQEGRWGWGLLGGGREGGEDERGRTLTPHGQHLTGCSEDTRSLIIWSAFPCGFHPACVTPPLCLCLRTPLRLGGPSIPLSAPPLPRTPLCLSLPPPRRPSSVSHTSPGPHPAGPGTHQEPARVPM